MRCLSASRLRSLTLPWAVLAAAVAFGLPASALAADHAPAPASTAAGRAITDQDLLRFTWIADPQLSPDGREVVFVRVVANERTDDYDTSLWRVPADGSAPPRALTRGSRDSAPRWSPDGRRLLFVRPVSAPGGTPTPQLHVLDLQAGGEAVALTSLPRGAGDARWSPDGRAIAFTSATKPEDLLPSAAGAGRPSDVRVITRASYRFNGRGWLDHDRPSRVWRLALDAAGLPASAPQALTDGRFNETLQTWSADGQRVLFTSLRVSEPAFEGNRNVLYAVPAAGGALQTVARINGAIDQVRLSPDGQWLAFIGADRGTPERSYSQPDLWVARADGSGAPRNLTSGYDFDIGAGLAGDQAAPRGGRAGGPVWSADGRHLVVGAGQQGTAPLVRVEVATGRVSPLLSGRLAVQQYSAAADGQRVVALVGSATRIGELHLVDVNRPPAAGALPPALTDVNGPLFKQLRLREPEEVWWTSFDGQRIQGWLQLPGDFDPSRRYPLILQIHGGPHSAYGEVFTHEFHAQAARGYAVLYSNPRGSNTYGQAFGNVIQFRYPGDDHRDLMAGVDLITQRPYIDAQRLGVTGGSGGGLLTNWAVTQTTRFKAAVSQRDISDWTAFWYTADFTQFTNTWFRQPPWVDPQDYAARSPITHVAKIQTPMMFILGDADWRTPSMAGGEPLFRALKLRRVPTVMVNFPGENHDLSRSGKPQHRIERLQHISGWMDRWLMGRTDLYPDANP